MLNNKNKDIHLFNYKNMKLVYDVNSGSLHRVDDLGWELISLILDGLEKQEIIYRLQSSFPPEEIISVFLQVEEMQKNNLLFSPEPALREEALSPHRVKSLCLFVTHACNLSCKYCFARKEGNYRPVHMSSQVAQKAVDFLLEGDGPRFREIDFFGGEPLLHFPLVKETVNYAKKRASLLGREVTFTVTTNALLLDDEVADFLEQENINVIISIDGRPQVHDLMRSRENSRGSYTDTVCNAENFVLKRKFDNYYIRGTYTRENLDFCEDVKHLLNLGFESLSLEPVIAPEEEGYALREEDLPRLEKEYDRVAELYLERKLSGRPFTFYHFEMDLEKGPCLYKRLSGCGAGTEYLAVSPGGDLYPCHHFIEEKAFFMGNLLEKPFSLRREVGENVFRAAREREKCLSCWARYLCGMGCSASSALMAGGLEKNYGLGCSLQKIRLERALYLQAAAAVANAGNEELDRPHFL
ncbi:MAG: thioether cross-link-forming SCIFF peptide maturase [Firmicutes bacterium]|nr:thioether cross-link-forming SCIFF peptide maturase [Bacillota bacterium]